MKKFMNDPAAMAQESLFGFAAAHADRVALDAGGKFLRRRDLTPGKVGLVSGGGAGHEPLHIGFVGQGMLDAACPGHVFTSPTPDQVAAAIEAVDQGAGVLLIVKNYDGDLMNFEMAAETAIRAGRRVETVVVADDVAAGQTAARRRGIAGTLFVEKILGAAAEAGMPLAELVALGHRASTTTRSIGAALRGATLPTASRETFVLGAGEMELGVGIHGEPGGQRAAMQAGADIVATMCNRLLDGFDHGGEGVLLFVNGLGATPQSELYLVYGFARRFLESRGIAVARSLVGSYVTSLDMHGASITVASLDDDLRRLWDAPVATPALNW